MSFFVQRHAFHLVDPSILPFLTGFGMLSLTFGSLLFFHGFTFGWEATLFGISCILLCKFFWWRDITRESTFEGVHTGIVQLGMRYAVILFIVSEIMFFLHFFEHFLQLLWLLLLKLDPFDHLKVSLFLIQLKFHCWIH